MHRINQFRFFSLFTVRFFFSLGFLSIHKKVPTQDNSSDCGVYLLHYLEMFVKDENISVGELYQYVIARLYTWDAQMHTLTNKHAHMH